MGRAIVVVGIVGIAGIVGIVEGCAAELFWAVVVNGWGTCVTSNSVIIIGIIIPVRVIIYRRTMPNQRQPEAQ